MKCFSKISIIIPCYNQGAYISECLNSVLAQSYTNWECIIVNDGSIDNSEEVALAYVQKDSRIKYFSIQNSGVSHARNYGIAQSTGTYILPLDADDVIGSNYIELALTYYQENPHTTLVYCNAEFFGDKTGFWELPDYSFTRLLSENLIFCSAIFKRSDFNNTTGYCERMKHGIEDWDFWLTLLNENSEVYKIPQVCFYYRIKQVSRTTNLNADMGNQKQMLDIVFQNHIELYSKYFYNPIELYSQLQITQGMLDAFIKKHEREKQKYEDILSSKTYRLGFWITWPRRFIKKIINGENK